MGGVVTKLRQPYFSTLNALSAGAAYDELKDAVVKREHVLRVQHCSVENDTSAYTELKIGVEQQGTYHFQEDEQSPVAAELYWTRSVITVPEGGRLAVRCTGCTAGDNITVEIQGLLQEV